MPLFSIYAPDYTDEDAINRRLAVRQTHLDTAAKNKSMSTSRLAGRRIQIHMLIHNSPSEVGGAMLSPNEALDKPDAEKKMIGSFMILECDTYEDAKKMIETDVYWTGNVVRMPLLRSASLVEQTSVQWDKEKTVIRPFVTPKPL